MNPTPTYKIGPEIIARHEDALMQELPALYPDEGEREIVEQVLIPQFRALLMQVLEEFEGENGRASVDVVAPAELPVLCVKVDDAISENRSLLDIDGLFKPLFERLQSVREEVATELEGEFMQKCREVFAGKGVIDRTSLLAKGHSWFKIQDFTPFGKGFAFAKAILGRQCEEIGRPELIEIADALDYHERSEESIKIFIASLAAQGIVDRKSLLDRGHTWFKKSAFPPFGKGSAFAKAILGRSTKEWNNALLEKIADILGFPQIKEEDLKAEFLSALAANDISDRFTLRLLGPTQFREYTFGEFGKGSAFVGAILGRTILSLTVKDLEDIADRLELPHLSEQSKSKINEILAAHGLVDRQSFLSKTLKWFGTTEFPPFGKGRTLIGLITGEKFKSISSSLLEKTADILDFKKPTENEKYDLCRKALAAHGISDKTILLSKGSNWFRGKDFPPFGGIKSLASTILGRSLSIVAVTNLIEIAEKLDLPEMSEQTRIHFVSILAEHNITDRWSLYDKGVAWFIKNKFAPYGRGPAFGTAILGRTVKEVSSSIFDEIIEKLSLDDLTEEHKQMFIQTLSDHGVTDRYTLQGKGVRGFRYEEFHPFGKGMAFAGAILGRTITVISNQVFDDIAKKLDLPEMSEHSFDKFRSALAEYGIVDRDSLLDSRIVWFMKTEFHPFGKGCSFAGSLLGKSVHDISSALIVEIADVLFPENQS